MRELARRVVATIAAAVLVALVAGDLLVRRVRTWGNGHSLTGSVVTSLLGLAVAALIVDEVVARRQRRERAVSVAVQALIVYGQARRALNAVVAARRDEGVKVSPAEELRSLATMLLTAAPNLFDDLDARRFLEEAERLSVLLVRAAADRSGDAFSASVELARSRLDAAAEPLVSRIPAHDRALLEGQS
ncbi:MAG TPA: hypothetical protein VFA83_18940 [Acidimicrobiales bacterium]|nr:hypothetical protein [Acidimicrobiales bacterium]